MFARVEIYCSGSSVCFHDIENSDIPTIIINTEHIVSISDRTSWGFCEGHQKFPYRIMQMDNGEKHYCVVESIEKLIETLK